jgi:hypothetical protein
VQEPDAVEYGDVLRLADCALYEAKKAGKNQAIGMLPTRERPLPLVETVTAGKETGLAEQLAAQFLRTQGPGCQEPDGLVSAKAAAATQGLI